VEHKAEAVTLVVPLSIVSRGDIMRAHREATRLSEVINQAALLQTGASVSIPRIGAHLQAFADANHFDIAQSAGRQHLVAALESLKSSAPSVHVSFATEPSAEAIERVLAWFRQSVDARIVLQTGLQPSIVAGCVLRTSSKVFDFSLRQRFQENRDVLYQKVAAL
jgi:F0F1-type ATP synthase delta subunit